MKTTVGIAALGSGEIEVDLSVTATNKMSGLEAAHGQIYNASGKCVKTFCYTDSGYGYMIGHNKAAHTASVFYQGVPGQRYYTIVTFYAGNLNGAGGESSHISTIITA